MADGLNQDTAKRRLIAYLSEKGRSVTDWKEDPNFHSDTPVGPSYFFDIEVDGESAWFYVYPDKVFELQQEA